MWKWFFSENIFVVKTVLGEKSICEKKKKCWENLLVNFFWWNKFYGEKLILWRKFFCEYFFWQKKVLREENIFCWQKLFFCKLNFFNEKIIIVAKQVFKYLLLLLSLLSLLSQLSLLSLPSLQSLLSLLSHR